MFLLVIAWMSCAMLTVWALFVAGRLRSVGWSSIALVLGLAPLASLLARHVPWPRLDLVDVLGLAAGSTFLLGLWGAAVHWARRTAMAPRVDASRMRWVPRPSHRPTWVIAAGFSTLLSLGLVALDGPLVSVLPWVPLLVAYRWAHQGERGPIRVEARDVVLGTERVGIDELSKVVREVRFLGPIRRERLVIRYGEVERRWLVTGSPSEHGVAVQHLLLQQQGFAAAHAIHREPPQRPPEWLRDIYERGGRPVSVATNREAT
ncbi:MAG: hypothetical protein AAF211_19120 [Myxococcota bacterium]